MTVNKNVGRLCVSDTNKILYIRLCNNQAYIYKSYHVHLYTDQTLEYVT